MQLTSQPHLILVPRPHKEVREHQKCVLKSEKVSMASSMFLSPLSCPTLADNRELSSRIILHKSTFLPSPNFFFPTSVHSRRRNGVRGYCYRSPVAKSFDHIPKQFRQENLKDGRKCPLFTSPSSFYRVKFHYATLIWLKDRLICIEMKWFRLFS